MKTTTISLGNHFEKFIQEKVDSGRYKSVDEVIRSSLRLLESHEKMENVFITSIKHCEDYELEEFDAKKFMEELELKNQWDVDFPAEEDLN